MKTVFIAGLLLLAGCGLDQTQPNMSPEPLESALIIGSAESPDPVLARVMELEKSGAAKDVVVNESFPVQVRLRASRKVIDELNRIPPGRRIALAGGRERLSGKLHEHAAPIASQ